MIYIIPNENSRAGILSANKMITSYLLRNQREAYYVGLLQSIALLYKTKNVTILLTNNNFLLYAFPLMVMKLTCNIRVIFILHGFTPFKPKFYKALVSYFSVSLASRLAKSMNIRFVSNSELTRSFYLRFLMQNSKVLRFTEIADAKPAMRSEENTQRDFIKIVLGGRSVPHKNLHWIVENLDISAIEEKISKKLVVEVYSDIVVSEENHNIQVKGFVNQKDFFNALGSADMFINFCLLEPYGLVTLEALNLGIPCLVHKYSGILEEPLSNIYRSNMDVRELNTNIIQILKGR